MASFKYDNACSLFATKQLDWVGDAGVSAMLVSGVYAPDRHLHQFVNNIPAAAIISRLGALTGRGQVNGVCFGTIPELFQFLSATQIVGLVLYKNTGNDATSTLIYYSSDGVGFPFFAQGFNYLVGFDQTNGGFFQV